MPNMHIERLRNLPQRTEETWQAAAIELPIWMTDDDGMPTRLRGALCVSTLTGSIGPAAPRLAPEPEPMLVLESLATLASNEFAGYRPGRLELNQADVAAELAPALARIGIKVIERPHLEFLDQAIHALGSFVQEELKPPAAQRTNGVTISHQRAFAEAAWEYYQAAPWKHLDEQDLIEVVAPKAERGLKFLTVMGAAGQSFGLAFFESRAQYERLLTSGDPNVLLVGRGVWSLTFEPISALPPDEMEIWREHGSAAVHDDVFPEFLRLGPKISRPNPEQLAYAEGLLRALARTAEAEMDAGHWAKTVSTASGDSEYRISLPLLLEPVDSESLWDRAGKFSRRDLERSLVDIQRATADLEFASFEEYQEFLNTNFCGEPVQHAEPRNDLERAQDLVHRAVAFGGRRQLQMLRTALETSPDCADAFVALAERKSDPAEAKDLYLQGVAAGERVLGTKIFTEDAGRFWGLLETRPYMRARFGLAQCLEQLGKRDEAAEHYQAMLQLNPNDNQGARYYLAGCLLGADRLDALDELLVRYEERSAHWLYIAALAAYTRHGNNAQSRAVLASAHKANSLVCDYIMGHRMLPYNQPEFMQFGSDDEAVVVASELIEDWKATPGAVAWLRNETSNKPRGRRSLKKSKGRKRRH